MKRIRKLRLEQGLSQAEVARRAGINQTSLCKIEAGKEPIFPIRGRKLADVLGWEGSVDELVEDVDDA